MSSRYGRNQRRRHRETIAGLEVESANLRRDLFRARAENDSLERQYREWDSEIRRLLGPYTAFQRETPVLAVRSVRDFGNVALHEPMNGEAVRFCGPETSYEVKVMRMEKLLAGIVLVGEDGDPLRTLMRIRIEDDRTKESRLAVSRELLHHGLGGQERAYIAERIARDLTDHFNANHVRKEGWMRKSTA